MPCLSDVSMFRECPKLSMFHQYQTSEWVGPGRKLDSRQLLHHWFLCLWNHLQDLGTKKVPSLIIICLIVDNLGVGASDLVKTLIILDSPLVDWISPISLNAFILTVFVFSVIYNRWVFHILSYDLFHCSSSFVCFNITSNQ